MLRIAFRNLFRQKRRNILLGSAISIGTLLLIVAHSFSHGISDTLINEVVSYVAGHTNIGFAHEGRLMSQVLRGGAHWEEKIAKIPGVKKVEPTMGIMGRVIGNGKSDNAFLVAMNMHQNFSAEDSLKTSNNFPMVEGSWDKLKDTTIENPLILSVEKAKYLNVKMGEIVRVRMQDFSGRFQAARLTVVGIFKPSNMFMDGALFIEFKDMSRLMGLRKEDVPYLYLTLENPARDAIQIADSIWRLLEPPLAVIASDKGLIIPVKGDSASRDLLQKLTSINANEWKRKATLVSKRYADSLQLKIGDTLVANYKLRFPYQSDSTEIKQSSIKLVLTGIYPDQKDLPSNVILRGEAEFYPPFYDALPLEAHQQISLAKNSPWTPLLGTEWVRLPRSRSTTDLQNVRREISSGKHKATTVTVDTMYESASSVLQLESALKLITLYAVLVIFFIILIGVVNTLRMTIRERTREIGTLRAIGMQKSDVRKIFLYETGLLALFSSILGTILAFATMAALSSIYISSAGNPIGIILVNNHLVFVPTVLSVTFFNILIVCLALITAFIPAHKAAKLPAATALRHYE